MFFNTRFIKDVYRWGSAAVVLIAVAPAVNAAPVAPTMIVAQSSGKCLDVIGGVNATGNGIQLEQWVCVPGADNQIFTLQEMGGGRYQIIASHSNKCVGTVNGGTSNGTRIEQRDCAKLPQQIWSVASSGATGQYKIVSAQSGRCLAVNGTTENGVLMALWDCAASANQSWALTVPQVSPPVTVVAKHSGKCLDVLGGEAAIANGVRLDQWRCGINVDNQLFTFKYAGNDQYQLVAQHSGRCVEVVGASTANGAAIDQWDCNGAPQQLWRLSSVAGGYHQIISAVSGKCLDVTGGVSAVADGAMMEQWECVPGAANQLWSIGGAVSTTTTTAAATSTTTAASTTTTTRPPACSPTSLTPAIATQAAWDAKYNAQFGSTLPNTSRGAEDYAWQGHYWVRAYVSMAKTYGDTKYLATAARMIDFWMSHMDGPKGWGTSLGASQLFLDTGVIAEAITLFSYEVWKDQRFAAYRPKADAFIAQLEPILNKYNNQWVENAPYPGSPSFYVYNTCSGAGGLCSVASLVMYNQGTVHPKALLLIDRIKRLKGQTPDAAYLHKANKAAAYFKTFARLSGNAYVWDYGGARGNGVEDVSHAHLDLHFLLWARKYNLGGLTDTDMRRLAATMHKVLNGQAGPNDVSRTVAGTGLSDANTRGSIGYDWIDLADYDATLLDKTINIYNRYQSSPGSARPYLGWAEIQRKRRCVSLY